MPLEAPPDSVVSGQGLIPELACPTCLRPIEMEKDRVKCERCGVVAHVISAQPRFYNLTTPAERLRCTNDSPELWTRWRRLNYLFFEKELAPFPFHSRTLDVGTGMAPFFKLFSRYNVVGMDFQPFDRVHIVTDLTRDFPLRSGAFDLVVMSNAMEHIPNPEHLLKEIHRILKPGGTVINTVPFFIKIHQAPYDFLRYTEFMLQKLHEDAGFSDLRIQRIGNVSDIVATYEKVLRKRVLMEAGSSVAKTVLTKGAFLVSKYAKRIALKAVAPNVQDEADRMGVPWGYGTVAKRPVE